MKWNVMAFLAVSSLALANPVAENFDTQSAGAPPTGWKAAVTGEGEGRWTIVSDPQAPSQPNLLVQNGVGTFPICVAPQSVGDGTVQVAFCLRSGTLDQAAGVIFRYQDPFNYYVVRANANEDNLVAYKVMNGLRFPLDPPGPTSAFDAHMALKPGQWYTLRVDMQGDHYKVSLDGTRTLELVDETFPHSGQVGLWTRADCVTEFDDFLVEAR